MEVESKCGFSTQTADFKKLIRNVNICCFIFGITINLKYVQHVELNDTRVMHGVNPNTCNSLTKRELFRFSGVSALPKISNSFIVLDARFMIYSRCGLVLHINCVRWYVVIVFPEPDSPVTIIHCGFLCSFKAVTASIPTQKF